MTSTGQAKPARNLSQVIDQMLAVIPEAGEEVLRDELKSIQSSYSFSSPEMIGTWWREAGVALHNRFGTKALDGWAKQVAEIFIDRPME